MPLCPRWSWLALLTALAAAPAGAVSLGQSNSFQTPGTAGWATGANHPVPAAWIPDGGPDGPGDGFLQVQGLGGSGPASNLVALAGLDWAGNYLAAGITGLQLDLNNLGSTDLSMRVQLNGAGGTVYSLSGVVLPANSGWQSVLFSLAPDDLFNPGATVNPMATLAAVGGLRLVHMVAAPPPNAAVLGVLGIDNVSAVPEPASWGLMALGLALVATRRRCSSPRLP